MLKFALPAVVLAALAAGAFWWFGRSEVHPDRYGIQVVRFTVDSESVGSREQIGLVPGNSATQPGLLILLHGRGNSPAGMQSDEMFAALRDLGDRAPVVVLAEGGESSYWHNRAGGNWADYVTQEVIPQAVERFEADPERIAIGGISMGGFGALAMGLDGTAGFCGVGARLGGDLPGLGGICERGVR